MQSEKKNEKKTIGHAMQMGISNSSNAPKLKKAPPRPLRERTRGAKTN